MEDTEIQSSQSSGSATAAPAPGLQWVIPSDHPPVITKEQLLEAIALVTDAIKQPAEVLCPGPWGEDLGLSLPCQDDPVRVAHQEVSPSLAMRLTQAAFAAKYGASFFLALNTRHCTVPIGMDRAAAIS